MAGFINLTKKADGSLTIQSSDALAQKALKKEYGSDNDRYTRPNVVQQAFGQVAQTVSYAPDKDLEDLINDLDPLQRFR